MQTPSNQPQKKLTKEQARRILWAQGNLKWKLRPEQRLFKAEIDNASKQLVVGNISRRWGKTFTLVLYAIEQAIKKKQKIRYAAAFREDVEEFVLPAFEQILEDCPKHIKPVWRPSKNVWRFPNGSEIKLVGLDKKRNGLRGNAINIIILDEAGFIDSLKYQYTSVIIPATAKQKNIKIVVISTPPESPEHYFCELMTKAQVQANGYYLCLTIDDISDLDPEERQRLLDEVGGEHSTTAQREFFCKVKVDAARAIAPSFDDKKHIGSLDINPKHIAWRVFGDVGGVKDLSVFLLVGYDWNTGKVYFADELWFPRFTPTTTIMKEVKAKWPGLTIVADMHGQTRVDFSVEGLSSAEADGKVDKRGNMIDAGLPLLNTAFHNDRLVIDPKCKLLIRTLEGGMLNMQRSDFERTDSLGHCDAVAAAVYGYRGVDRITDLRPKPSAIDTLDIIQPRSKLALSLAASFKQ